MFKKKQISLTPHHQMTPNSLSLTLYVCLESAGKPSQQSGGYYRTFNRQIWERRSGVHKLLVIQRTIIVKLVSISSDIITDLQHIAILMCLSDVSSVQHSTQYTNQNWTLDLNPFSCLLSSNTVRESDITMICPFNVYCYYA